MKKVAATGGPTLALCDAPFARGGTWSSQGVIVFAPNIYTGLFKVPATGGDPTALTTPDANKGETHRWPEFLPDGEHFIFLAGTAFGPSDAPSGFLRVGSLHSSESKPLIQSHANGFYASGHLLFLHGNTLMAQPFNPTKLQLFGDPVPIADPVYEDVIFGKSMASASQEGTLVYLNASAIVGRQLFWVDRTGKKIDEVPGLDSYRAPRLSLDGNKIAFTLMNSGFDLWNYDMQRRVKTKLTFGSGTGQGNLEPVWSPDGHGIAYTKIENGTFSIYSKAGDGSGTEEVLLKGNTKRRFVTDWSRDGKFIAYQESQGGVFILALTGNRNPYQFQPSSANQIQAVFSPDGRWVAYCSAESGEEKVFVAPFAGSGGKWQVSSGGGCMPRWGKDGRELFYFSSDRKITSAEIKTTESTLTVIAVKPLFETRLYRTTIGGFDVSPDGQRFILAYDSGQPNAVISLVEDWDAELKTK